MWKKDTWQVDGRMQNKYEKLKTILRGYGRVAVAFSGGVDSAFLLWAAAGAAGRENVLAVTALPCSFPEREQKSAENFCREYGIRQVFCGTRELEIDGFRKNPENRCYLCKRHLLEKILGTAADYGISIVAEGTNADDGGDYRPGMQAVAESGVKSPLRLAGMGKDEIRALSREFGLPVWNKPALACLYTRFACGETLSEERVRMVDRAEQFLLGAGLREVRVRVHGEGRGTVARIEVPVSDFPLLMEEGMREKIYRQFRALGFTYTALDLLGYRRGSMNEGRLL